MYIFNLKGLKDEMVKGPLPEREQVKYLLVYVALTSVSILSMYSYETNNWDVLAELIFMAIGVLGVVYFYIKNGGAQGERFLEKYFALGFVTAVRFLLYMIPVLLVYGVLAGALDEGYIEMTTQRDVILLTVTGLVFTWYFGKQIEEVRKRSEGQEK